MNPRKVSDVRSDDFVHANIAGNQIDGRSVQSKSRAYSIF